MSKVFMRYTAHVHRRLLQCFPVIAAFFLSFLFAVSIVRYLSETQHYDKEKGFRVGTLFASVH